MDVGHFHAFIHGLAHVVDGQKCHLNAGQGLHLHAGPAGGADGAGRPDGGGLFLQFKAYLHLGQMQQVAEGNQLGGLLGPHDSGHPGHAQHVALSHFPFLYLFKAFPAHGDTALSHSLPCGLGLGAYVHHDGLALAVKMCKFTHALSQ